MLQVIQTFVVNRFVEVCPKGGVNGHTVTVFPQLQEYRLYDLLRRIFVPKYSVRISMQCLEIAFECLLEGDLGTRMNHCFAFGQSYFHLATMTTSPHVTLTP